MLAAPTRLTRLPETKLRLIATSSLPSKPQTRVVVSAKHPKQATAPASMPMGVVPTPWNGRPKISKFSSGLAAPPRATYPAARPIRPPGGNLHSYYKADAASTSTFLIIKSSSITLSAAPGLARLGRRGWATAKPNTEIRAMHLYKTTRALSPTRTGWSTR